jgi:hypothetical protein
MFRAPIALGTENFVLHDGHPCDGRLFFWDPLIDLTHVQPKGIVGGFGYGGRFVGADL